MTKKILLLVLSLPLLLMLCLFTTSETVSLAISIPVNGITINFENNERIIYLDMDKNETYKVDYEVTPSNAANKNVSFSTEEVAGERLAQLEFDESTKTIIPKSSGAAKVCLSTIDGGFKESFIVNVSSTSIEEIISSIENKEVYVGDEFIITNEFIPSNTNKLVTYVSSDESVVKYISGDTFQAVGKGNATIKVISNVDENVYDTVEVIVHNKDIMDLSYVSKTWNETADINISLNVENVKYNITYVVTINGKEIKNPNIDMKEIDTEKLIATYTFDKDFVGVVSIEFSIQTALGKKLSQKCLIERVNEINVDFDNYSETPYIYQGGISSLTFNLTPKDAKVKYNVYANNDNISVSMSSNAIIIDASNNSKPGVTTITLEVSVDGIENSTKTASIDIVIRPKTFMITQSAQTFGDEQLLTFGSTDVNGDKSTYDFSISYGKTDVSDSFLNNIHWKSSNEGVIVENGKLYINDSSITKDDEVIIYAVFEYGTFKLETAGFKIRCIGNGVNVYCYEDLLNATRKENPVPIIVHNDIVKDFGKYKNGEEMPIQDIYTTIKTTYDRTYYENLEKEGLLDGTLDDALAIKVLISFKSDVYGNGNTINAHNITHKIDATGALDKNALFKGPLNFVAVTETGASAVSVKGQDNICFALYEGASLNNIQLKGCTLDSGQSQTYDLTDLTYVGTVVEVLGDNVSVNFCRISNGRTIMRIFGDINDCNKIINVNINNSILSGAREFIIRMGSNKFVQGTKEDTSPYINPQDRLTFPVYTHYKDLLKQKENKKYDDAYITTYVTVKNCAFKDCGIFTFGLDSHFSGQLLANGKDYVKDMPSLSSLQELFKPWYDLAKTSYGAKLIFEGEVAIYDWKEIDNIDSSTLIDISLGGSFDSIFSRLVFDVKELVRIAAKKDQFSDIIYTDTDGKEYVHGGIAFFGGGKNYCCFEDKRSDSDFAEYTVSLADVDQSYLNLAAGNESFYFLLYNEKSSLTPIRQKEILSSPDAYDFVFKK